MLTKNIFFRNFKRKKNNTNIRKHLNKLVVSDSEVIKSLTNNYHYSYTKQKINKFKKFKDVRIFGMGGSSLGANAIYDFLRFKIKKNSAQKKVI